MSRQPFPRVASFKTAEAFRAHLAAHGIRIDLDDRLAPAGQSPLAQPFEHDGLGVGNRFCILPMEGWDGTRAGEPTDLTRRRWRRFGASGAKLIWGGEAVAVRHDGRANPNQLMITASTVATLSALRQTLVDAHRERFGSNADTDLVIGLQLTHSGRFASPDATDRPAPLVACPDSILDQRFPGGVRVLTDADLERLVDDFASAARLAWDAGFQFVDVKQCHGYLGHELLGAHARRGRYGGPIENRLRFLREVIEAIRASVPGLRIGVRLSAFDVVPYGKDTEGVGAPMPRGVPATREGFGVLAGDDLATALRESHELLTMIQQRGVRWVSVTAGSPYYCPHVQRPAFSPPLDGYLPPDDPLRGVALHLRATAALKAAFPQLAFVGAAYSYLQEWLPHVAERSVREGRADFVGLGRMVLAYPDLPADLLAGTPLRRRSICRTFSDCTTGPRLGLVSGCYPLDPLYGARPEAARIRRLRTEMIAGH